MWTCNKNTVVFRINCVYLRNFKYIYFYNFHDKANLRLRVRNSLEIARNSDFNISLVIVCGGLGKFPDGIFWERRAERGENFKSPPWSYWLRERRQINWNFLYFLKRGDIRSDFHPEGTSPRFSRGGRPPIPPHKPPLAIVGIMI